MKLPHILAGVLALIVPSLFAGDNWQTDYKAALEQAGKENKLVLLDFTGSDWCGWCIKLDREVFSKPEFKDFASKNLVLVEIDFPRNKKQSSELQKQNEQLQEKFNVEGYPTLVLVDSKGKEVSRGGYLPGGPSAIIDWVKSAKK